MILRRVFEDRSKGFYVDIGAHHPRRFSNTYHFYRMGWAGINVDATPGSMEPFRRLRPRDTNIEAAVSREPREITFYLYNEPALNTFIERSFNEASPYHLVGERTLMTRTLGELLSQYLPTGQKIDFLSIDVEGMDLEVLESNDWQRFRPGYVLVECRGGSSINQVSDDDTVRFLEERRYVLLAKTLNTLIFREAAPQPVAPGR